MKKHLILSLTLVSFQASAFTYSKVLKTSVQKLANFYPGAANIVNRLRNMYSDQEFNIMVQDIINGTLSASLIEKFYYRNNQDLKILHSAIETARRENPRIIQGRNLIKGKYDTISLIYNITGHNQLLTNVFHSLRTFYDNDESFQIMLIFAKENISQKDLWEMHIKTNSDSKKFYDRITDLQWIQSL